MVIPTDVVDLEDLLAEAWSVFARLPDRNRPGGFVSSWPEFRRNREDGDFPDAPTSKAVPSPREIDQAEVVLRWINLLAAEDERRLVKHRASGQSFNMMVGRRWKFRRHARRRKYTARWLRKKHADALEKILIRLKRNNSQKAKIMVFAA